MENVPKHMLSRMLYANPVCILTVGGNAMTLTWLTCLDNHGHFLASLNAKRHSASLLMSQPPDQRLFVLSVPTEGMEALVWSIGSRSGREDVSSESDSHPAPSKLLDLGVATCLPGWRSTDAFAQAEHQLKETQRGKKQKVDASAASFSIQHGLVALSDCVAHLICRVEEVQDRHGHHVLFCLIEAAFVKHAYWDGKNFAPLRDPATRELLGKPYFSFLGTKCFAVTIPLSIAPETASSSLESEDQKVKE
ncbi:hypothetical protein BC830DRAFT_1169051 [Chytriomyces sp. MP71]|nr:hypothetical protein BC830DRAFT_1169051 [Chytriomyces sp. MP71]